LKAYVVEAVPDVTVAASVTVVVMVRAARPGLGPKPKGTADTAEAASRIVLKVVGVRSILD